MKQNKYGTWAVGAFMLLLSAAACTDSYESTPVDMFTEDYLFSRTDSNGTVVRKYLNRIYYYMRNGHNGVNGDYLDAASDDALSVISSESDVYKLAIGRYSASNLINSDMIWSDPYLVIRRVNILLSGSERRSSLISSSSLTIYLIHCSNVLRGNSMFSFAATT